MQKINLKQNNHDEIDFRKLFVILSASKLLIITITLAFTIAALIYTYSQSPVYQSSAIIKLGTYPEPTLKCENEPELSGTYCRSIEEKNSSS